MHARIWAAVTFVATSAIILLAFATLLASSDASVRGCGVPVAGALVRTGGGDAGVLFFLFVFFPFELFWVLAPDLLFAHAVTQPATQRRTRLAGVDEQRNSTNTTASSTTTTATAGSGGPAADSTTTTTTTTSSSATKPDEFSGPTSNSSTNSTAAPSAGVPTTLSTTSNPDSRLQVLELTFRMVVTLDQLTAMFEAAGAATINWSFYEVRFAFIFYFVCSICAKRRSRHRSRAESGARPLPPARMKIVPAGNAGRDARHCCSAVCAVQWWLWFPVRVEPT